MKVRSVKLTVSPDPPGAWGAIVHAARPPPVIPSAFPPGFVDGLLELADVAFRGVVPLIAPIFTAQRLVLTAGGFWPDGLWRRSV